MGITTDRQKDPIDWNFKSFLQSRYSMVPKNDLEKILDNFLMLAELARDPRRDLKSILDQSAKLIFRLFDFGEIAIGLRDPKDGLYRYEVLFGYSKSTEIKYRQVTYTPEDMVSYDLYPFVKTGKISELDPAEGVSDGEKELFDRPLAVTKPRTSPDEFLEGDYIDVWMYDDNKQLIGWYELSKPRGGKMPPSESLRWIEVLVELCALIVQRRTHK